MGIFDKLFDTIFAPSGTDSTIDHHPSTPMTGSSYEQVSEWHNNFGTAADHQVPAESGHDTTSWDWSSVADSDWGSSDW